MTTGERPYSNAEDDSWFDAIDLRAAFAEQHYGQTPETWAQHVHRAVIHITEARQYLLRGGIPLVRDSLPPPKVVVGSYSDRDQQAHMGVEFD